MREPGKHHLKNTATHGQLAGISAKRYSGRSGAKRLILTLWFVLNE